MNVKRELLALAIRILANETSLVRKPDAFEMFINAACGVETYDQHLARNIEVELDRAAETVKRVKTNRTFKKIVKSM